jgi:hypothetical protein
MEVHHHPHVDSDSHRKKGFKEYFLEFLMIFLAVTLGFFAESFREHLANKEKENHYIQSLISDLRADTLGLHYDLIYERLQYRMLDSALEIPIEKLGDPNVQDTFFHYVFLYYSLPEGFNQQENAILQLRAGGFNIISNSSAIDSINHTYSLLDLLKTNLKFFESGYFDFAHAAQNIMRLPKPAATPHDSSITIIPKNKEIFFVNTDVEKERLYNVIRNSAGSFKTDMIEKKQASKMATSLIVYLQKQYRLK